MRRKVAVGMLVAAIVILAACIYALFFGNNEFLKARDGAGKGNISSTEMADSDGASLEISSEKISEGDRQDISGEAVQTSEEGVEKDENSLSQGQAETVHLIFRRGSNADLEEELPGGVLDAIEVINAGGSLYEATGIEETKGYYALTRTNVIIAEDEETGEKTTGSGRLTLYVPNLVEGLKDVSALFYDCHEDQWRVIPAEVVDPEGKRISVTIGGSGVVTTVHRVE